MPIYARMFRPMIIAFWLSTVMNGLDCVVHLPDPTATINLPCGMMHFPLLHVKFFAAAFGGINFNLANLSFVCSLFAVFSFKKDIGFPETAIAKKFLIFFSVLQGVHLDPLCVSRSSFLF